MQISHLIYLFSDTISKGPEIIETSSIGRTFFAADVDAEVEPENVNTRALHTVRRVSKKLSGKFSKYFI